MTRGILLALQTYPDPAAAPATRTAMRLASRLGASVTALAVEAVFPPVGNPLSEMLLQVGERIRAAEAQSRERADRLLAEATAAADAAGVALVPERAHTRVDALAEPLVEAARSHDLVVLSASREGPMLGGAAEILVFETGRPVLLVPDDAVAEPDLDHVAIATDYGRAATRALFDAMPLVAAARSVTVLVADDKAVPSGLRTGLEAHLARHGVAASFRAVATAGRPVGEALQAEAIAVGAGILVMGAYGHSRWREFVLGGATETVLMEPRLPVLMSH